MTRGLVVPLTAAQRVARARYLAGLTTIDTLDGWVRKPKDIALHSKTKCATIYYRLPDHNGGKDPTAPDPADRWKSPGGVVTNITCDCSGGDAWMGGYDRYQPVRGAHLYDGWFNTDSKRMDAARVIGRKSPRRCFERVCRPEPGCIVVYASDPMGQTHGVKVGHEGTVIDVPLEWDPRERDCWRRLGVVDVAGRVGRANKLTTGLAWWARDAWFLVPVMVS